MKKDPNLKTRANQDKDASYWEYIQPIMESLDQCIVIVNQQARILLCNSRLLEQFQEAREAVGKPLRSLFPRFWEEYRGEVWGEVFLKDVLELGKKRMILRMPLEVQNKKIRYFDLTGIPLKNKEDRLLGALLMMQDVTENIHLENQLLRQARTSSLANLGASIAHEIRNPLNSISLHIQLVKEWLQSPADSSPEEIIESLDNVLYEIKRLNELIRYFLRFSRPPEPQLEAQDLHCAILQAIRLLEEQARVNNVEIITHFDNLPLVMIDRNQISQAVYNICLNAIQAMKTQGGGKLEISTFETKGYVLIEIKDNGSGLSPQAKEKLFDLFFTTKEEGSGLGLPISNQIVERHEGRIVAENNLDRGACFSIYLPIRPIGEGS